MGYSTDVMHGFGFALGDRMTYGHDQGPVWITTLKDYAGDEEIENLIAAEYDKLRVELGGDLTFEGHVYVIAAEPLAPADKPNDETFAQLQAFAERFDLAMTPVWHEWTVRA